MRTATHDNTFSLIIDGLSKQQDVIGKGHHSTRWSLSFGSGEYLSMAYLVPAMRLRRGKKTIIEARLVRRDWMPKDYEMDCMTGHATLYNDGAITEEDADFLSEFISVLTADLQPMRVYGKMVWLNGWPIEPRTKKEIACNETMRELIDMVRVRRSKLRKAQRMADAVDAVFSAA